MYTHTPMEGTSLLVELPVSHTFPPQNVNQGCPNQNIMFPLFSTSCKLNSILTKRKRSDMMDDQEQSNGKKRKKMGMIRDHLGDGGNGNVMNVVHQMKDNLGHEDGIYILSPLKRKKVFVQGNVKRRRDFGLRNLFEKLPSEIIKYIFSMLDIGDFGNCYLVSWIWHNYSEDEGLWLCHYRNIWKTDPQRALYMKINPIGWKKLTLTRRNIELQYFIPGDDHIVPKYSYFYTSWGDFLCNEASKLAKDVESARWLFFVALQEYHTAAALDPDDYKILIRWGDALSDLALTYTGKERDLLFVLSKDKFELAKTLMWPITNEETKLGSVDISYLDLS